MPLPTPDPSVRFDSDAAIPYAAAGVVLPVGLAGELRIWARSAMLVAVLCVLVPLHYLFRLVRYGSPFPMYFLRLATRLIGARLNIHGVPLKRDVFYLPNHVSWFDICVIGGVTGSAFVARAEIAEMKILGWMARLNRTVFTQRTARMNIAEQINLLREAIADTWSVVIFPEGSVTDGHSLLPFKTSMLSVLKPPPPGMLVQPMVIDYGPVAEWIGWLDQESGLDNARRIFARPGTFTVNLHFLDPFDPHDFSGRKAIAAEARRQIEERLVKTLGKPLRPFRYDLAMIGYVAPKEEDLNSPASAL
ncbi:lysophospholipid acyltransferase family protein [Novosphingobium sp. B 225]|uniref:lysophospholipid acyltransferase family protein n=1 Tax=Novosphingobium sp. B 225 TaxID=1961849 RepID=UPI000B4B743E|nr:lysophospholipid acyltransferase family protein [Novosphingobium sp. B 225]